MDREQEMIHQQMETTRAGLTDKLAALESKVGGTVQVATDAVESTKEAVTGTVEAVTGTVEAVKDTVEAVSDKLHETVAGMTDTVQQAVEGVKDSVSQTVQSVAETFNLKYQCERHPWLVFGGAVVVGCVGSALLGSGRHRHSGYTAEPRTSSPVAESPRASAASEKSNGDSSGGWMLSKLGGLSSLALGAMMGVVRDLVARAVPESLKERVTEEVDKLTQTFGGEPVQGSLLPEQQEKSESGQEQGRGQQDQNNSAGSAHTQPKGRQTTLTGNGR